jgi:hypothetical protein
MNDSKIFRAKIADFQTNIACGGRQTKNHKTTKEYHHGYL